MDMSSLESWFIPFMIGGSLSILISLYLIFTKSILNRITLGISLYFISGMIAIIVNQVWLMEIYNDLQASGMLFWVFLTGLISMLSQYGFIGLKNDNRRMIKVNSLILLTISVISFSLSYHNDGSRFLGEMLPFIALFGTHRILTKEYIDN
jgi:hypothetical protein